MLKNSSMIVFLSLFTVACTNAKQVNLKLQDEALVSYAKYNKPNYKASVVSTKKDTTEQDNANNINMNEAFMDFYKEWKNVKYKFGGNSKKGIDCSAFTQRVYKEKFNIKIPRTTRTQVSVGEKVKKSQLEMGDLVFFKTGKIDRHVGVYVGDGKFMHASIKGVKLTKLDKPFYKKAYWTSRRVIN